MKKNVVQILLVVLLLAGLAGGGYYLYEKKQHTPVIVQTYLNNVEINSNIQLSDINIKLENGALMNGTDTLNTTSLGEKSITLLLKNEYGYVNEYELSYTVIDTTNPTISNVKDLTVQQGGLFDAWKGIEVTDNSQGTITKNLEGSYDIDKIGTYPLTYLAVDESGNETREAFQLNVVERKAQDLTHEYLWEDQTIITDNGFTLEIIDHVAYIDGILIANKTYSIPASYGNGLTQETTDALNTMRQDAAALGYNLYNSSGFRSYNYQRDLYNNYCARRGQAKADTFSARPGFSEHQTGLSLDLNTIDQEFASTPEGQWVTNNCQNYGFIIRYPKGKDHITGYIYEPWHIRYVGTELAQKLYNNGDWITLEEYFGISSVYPEDYGQQ